ncbi:MAG: cation diffusion facilitator family transporter [Acinetobacter sp.]|nr:cation diffusion facilitator family transporter [Acinetobacter sp.]
MACSSCHSCGSSNPTPPPHYRYVLWIALLINALMFAVEIIMGMKANSVSLLSDSLDFLGDAANYGISLFVLNMALRQRARASLIKGYTMSAFGVWILGVTAYQLLQGELPNYHEMSIVGVIALIANLTVAALFFSTRQGDSNMRGVWLCSRNDAIGNLAIIMAAGLVYWSNSAYPDLIVALIMAYLAIQAGVQIIRQAKQELSRLKNELKIATKKV